MFEKMHTDLILISSKLTALFIGSPTPDTGGESGGSGSGFANYSIFDESYFNGTPVQVATKVTALALNILLTLGIVFFAWKVCSAAIDYFNRDVYGINARSQGRTLFYEIMEPVKGLAIMLVLSLLLNFMYGQFSSMLEGEAQQFQIQETEPLIPAPTFNTQGG